ncbi:MAG: YqeG family HAD IIIA-type phosphatase [Lachnospiraceae bacterium]|nr:YqeG family HAD IIIA-type phosphatase [Lachnospiraceae bacterium]
MSNNLYPTTETASAFAIPYESYFAMGKRGIIYDIDNTLVMHGAPADQRSIELFEKLRYIGFKTVLLSNNKEPRVKPFADKVGSLYVYKAGKPSLKGYVKAMELMGTTPETTLFVGDQIFTDVWGANRAGIDTVLTKPIDPREEIQIILKRRLEWFILRAYHRKLRNDSKKDRK